MLLDSLLIMSPHIDRISAYPIQGGAAASEHPQYIYRWQEPLSAPLQLKGIAPRMDGEYQAGNV